MSGVASLHFFQMESEKRDRFYGRLDDEGELMCGSLSQMAASGAVVGVLMIWLRMFAFRRSGILFVVSTVVMMMVVASMLSDLMAIMVATRQIVRMTSRCKQTVSQMQQNCTEGDDFEVLAKHEMYQWDRF